MKNALSTNRHTILLSWLFYGINCLLFEQDSLIYMIIGALSGIIILSLIYHIIVKEFSIFASYIALIIIVLPVSFRSIFCTGYDNIPIPWFYVLLLLLFAFQIIKRININIIILFIIVLLLFPLILSHNIFEGIKEYLGYTTFCVGALIAYGNRSNLTKKEYGFHINLYINGIIFISFGIIMQYIALNYFGVKLFRITQYAHNRNLLLFLFYDMSGNTVYMATAVLFLLFSNIKGRIPLCLIIVVSMALTSARTGLFSLILVLTFITIFEKNKYVHKIPLLVFLLAIGIGGLSILLTTRNAYTSITEMISNNNGRNDLVQIALQRFFNNPFLGNGLDFGKQLKDEGFMVPHNAIVNLLAQSGVFITFLFLYVFICCTFYSRNHSEISLFWCCILCAIGSSFSPSFFDLRFFTVIIMLCYMCPHNKTQLSNKINYQFKTEGNND